MTAHFTLSACAQLYSIVKEIAHKLVVATTCYELTPSCIYNVLVSQITMLHNPGQVPSELGLPLTQDTHTNLVHKTNIVVVKIVLCLIQVTCKPSEFLVCICSFRINERININVAIL